MQNNEWGVVDMNREHSAVVQQVLYKTEAGLGIIDEIKTHISSLDLLCNLETLEHILEGVRPVVSHLEMEVARFRGLAIQAELREKSLRKQLEDVEHEKNGDWKCESCGRWLSGNTPNVGVECDLCEDCAVQSEKEAV